MSKLTETKAIIESTKRLRGAYYMQIKAIKHNKRIAEAQNKANISGYDASIQRTEDEISKTNARLVVLKQKEEKLLQSKPKPKPKKLNSDTLF